MAGSLVEHIKCSTIIRLKFERRSSIIKGVGARTPTPFQLFACGGRTTLNANNTTFRVCRTCGKEYPLTTDYFHKHTNRLDIHCRDCVNQKLAEKRGYKQKRKKAMSAPEGYRCCTMCFQTFPETLEYFHKAGPRLNTFCKSCAIKKVSAWTKDHPEYARKKSREWAKNNPERAREFVNNARAKNRFKYNEINRRSLKRHRATANARQGERRTRKRNLPHTFTPQDWQYALEYFDHSCAVCGRRAGFWHVISQDHWLPLVNPDCPGTVPTNMVPLCHSVLDGEGGCNNMKNRQLPDKWLIKTYGEKHARTILARIDAYFATVRK